MGASITTTISVKNKASAEIKKLHEELQRYQSQHEKLAKQIDKENRELGASEQVLSSKINQVTKEKKDAIASMQKIQRESTKEANTERKKEIERQKRIYNSETATLQAKNKAYATLVKEDIGVARSYHDEKIRLAKEELQNLQKANNTIRNENQKQLSLQQKRIEETQSLIAKEEIILAENNAKLTKYYKERERLNREHINTLKKQNLGFGTTPEMAQGMYEVQTTSTTKQQQVDKTVEQYKQQLEKQKQIDSQIIKQAIDTRQKLDSERNQDLEELKQDILKRNKLKQQELEARKQFEKDFLNTAEQNKYNESIKKLNQLETDGIITSKEKQKALSKVNKELKESSSGHSNLTNQLVRHLRQIETLIVAYYTLTRAWDATIGKGLEVNKIIESNTMGIAALISANTKNIDSLGNTLTPLEKFTKGQEYAKDILAELRKESVKTYATFPQLIEIFQQATGQTLSMGDAFGTTLDDINKNTIQLATRMSNIAGSIGMPMDRVREEIRSMLSANASTDSLISTMLFGSPTQANEAINKAKQSADGLTKLLNKMLEPFDILADTRTYQKGILTLQNAWETAMGDMVQKSGMFQDITDAFYNMSDEIINNTDSIIETFDSLYDATKAVVSTLDEIAMLVATWYGAKGVIGAFEFASKTMVTYDNNTKKATLSLKGLTNAAKAFAIANKGILAVAAAMGVMSYSSAKDQKVLKQTNKSYENMYDSMIKMSKTKEDDIILSEKLGKIYAINANRLEYEQGLSDTQKESLEKQNEIIQKNLKIIASRVDLTKEEKKEQEQTLERAKATTKLLQNNVINTKLLEENTKLLAKHEDEIVKYQKQKEQNTLQIKKYEEYISKLHKNDTKNRIILEGQIAELRKHNVDLDKLSAKENQKAQAKKIKAVAEEFKIAEELRLSYDKINNSNETKLQTLERELNYQGMLIGSGATINENNKLQIAYNEKLSELYAEQNKEKEKEAKTLEKQTSNYKKIYKNIQDEIKSYKQIKTYKSDSIELDIETKKLTDKQKESLKQILSQLKLIEQQHEGISGAIIEYNESLGITDDKLKNIASVAINDMEDAFMSFIDGSSNSFEDFGDLAKNILKDIATQIARLGIVQPFVGGLTSLIAPSSQSVDVSSLAQQGFTQVAGNWVKDIAGQAVSISSSGQVLSGANALSSSGIGDLVGLASNANTAYNIFTNPIGWYSKISNFGSSISTSLLGGIGSNGVYSTGILESAGLYLSPQQAYLQSLATGQSVASGITPLGYGGIGLLAGGALGFGMDSILGADTYAGYTGMAGGALGGSGLLSGLGVVSGGWGVVIGSVLGSVVGGIFGKKKMVDSGLQFFEDTYANTIAGNVVQQYEIWKKKSWFSSKTSYFNNQLSERELSQIQAMFNTVDQMAQIVGGTGNLKIAAGRYSGTSISDELVPQYLISQALGYDIDTITPDTFTKSKSITENMTKVMYEWKQSLEEIDSSVSYEKWLSSNKLSDLELIRNDMIDEINKYLDDWKDIAEEMDSTVLEVISQSISAYKTTIREFTLYNTTDDLAKLKLQAEYAKEDLEILAKSAGVNAAELTVENFTEKYKQAISESFTQDTFNTWETLADAIIQADTASKNYIETLRQQKLEITQSIQTTIDSYKMVFAEIQNALNPIVTTLKNADLSQANVSNATTIISQLQSLKDSELSALENRYNTQLKSLEAEREALKNQIEQVNEASNIADILSKIKDIATNIRETAFGGATQYSALNFTENLNKLLSGDTSEEVISDLASKSTDYMSYLLKQSSSRAEYEAMAARVASQIENVNITPDNVDLSDIYNNLSQIDKRLQLLNNTYEVESSSINNTFKERILELKNTLEEQYLDYTKETKSEYETFLGANSPIIQELLNIKNAILAQNNFASTIKEAYQKTLGREADTSGEEYWQNQIATGNIAPGELGTALGAGAVASGEMTRLDYIKLIYEKGLRATPTQADLDYWNNDGTPITMLAQTMKTAAESAGQTWYQFATGTPYVPQDMPAIIHEGEGIIPKTFMEGVRDGSVYIGNSNNYDIINAINLLNIVMKQVANNIEKQTTIGQANLAINEEIRDLVGVS